MFTFVINEAVCANTGEPSRRCNCGCRRERVRNTRRARTVKPTVKPSHVPLGIPVWNFANNAQQQTEPETSSTPEIVFNYNKQRPSSGGLGLPVYHYGPAPTSAAQQPTAVSQPVRNKRQDGKPVPLGLPEWKW